MCVNEDLRKAANQIERSTIFAVFPLCAMHLPRERAEILDKLLTLLWKHEDKVITWADFADAWKESFPENKRTDEENTIQTIFDNRVKDESIAKDVIFGDNSDKKNSRKAMRIYYYFENKSVKDFIKHILSRYDINVRRFFEKSKEFIISDDIRKKLYNCREFNPSMLEEESYGLPLVMKV